MTMRFTPTTARLPVLAETTRSALSPFILAFDGIIIEKARKCGRRPMGKPGITDLAHAVKVDIAERIGHPLHPAITCYALRLCCGCYIEALDGTSSATLFRAQHELLDTAYRLITKLGGHDHTEEFLILEL
jgi:hypothetical protein